MAIIEIDGAKYATQSELLRGPWTPKTIASHLGEPSLTVPNLYGLSAARTKLWELAKVRAAEESDAFRDAQRARRTRRAQAAIEILESCGPVDRKHVERWMTERGWGAVVKAHGAPQRRGR